ncbi:hypothetical protein IJG78_03255 [Candidatus Saccharibacteria bacterium]|nr:hypothetical protein [Candidatus Saccharibacteria bacterium]MBR0415923.1 hypothetical protein [Candidatus Saccharibacteria bacterium]
MSKTNKILAGFGVATALGIAISPLAVFADDPTTVDGETTINAIIEEVISMSLVSSDSAYSYDCNSATTPNCSGTAQSASTNILPSQADTTSMYTIATVNTNSVSGYNLTLADSDTNNALTATAGTIAAIASEPVGGTNPGWAIAVDKASQTGTITWLQVPISTAAPLTIKSHHPSPAAVTVNDVTTVTYGVAASSSQPTGTYTDTVVYTATTGV